MERAIPDFSSCNSVDEWLDTIKMSRYKDHFAAGGYHTLGHVIGMNQGWVLTMMESIGEPLAAGLHQLKESVGCTLRLL